jgi:hypothetical protein
MLMFPSIRTSPATIATTGLVLLLALAERRCLADEPLPVPSASRYFQPDVEYVATLENCERHIMATEHRESWREIDWRPDLRSALKEARETGRPVLVFFFIEEFHDEGPT